MPSPSCLLASSSTSRSGTADVLRAAQDSYITRAIIFDIDGTLIDAVDLHAACWTEALGHFAIDVPFEDMRRQIGKGGDQILHGLIPPGILARHGQPIQA